MKRLYLSAIGAGLCLAVIAARWPSRSNTRTMTTCMAWRRCIAARADARGADAPRGAALCGARACAGAHAWRVSAACGHLCRPCLA